MLPSKPTSLAEIAQHFGLARDNPAFFFGCMVGRSLTKTLPGIAPLVFFLAATLSASAQSFSNLLDQAEATGNPLDATRLCSRSDAIVQPLAAANTVIEIRIERICRSEAIDGLSPTVGDQFIVFEGTVENLSEQGLRLDDAHAMLRVQSGNLELRARADAEELVAPDYAQPLDPDRRRRYTLVFDPLPELTAEPFLVLPAVEEQVRISLGSIDLLPWDAPQPSGSDLADAEVAETIPNASTIPAQQQAPSPTPAPIADGPRFSIVREAALADAGAIISRNELGTTVELTRGSTDGDLALLLNGLCCNAEPVVTLQPNEGDADLEIVVDLAPLEAAEIGHLSIDTRMRSTFAPVPQSVGLAISQDGPLGPWLDLGVVEVTETEPHLIVLALDEPMQASAIRVTPRRGFGGVMRLSEITVYESADPTNGSVLQQSSSVATGPAHSEGLIHAEYFLIRSNITSLDQIDFDQAPVFDQMLDEVLFSETGGSFWPGGPSDNFAARFRTELDLEHPKEMKLSLASDDGARVILNGEVVLDLDGRHATVFAEQTVQLPAGRTVVEVQYFEATGHAELAASWILRSEQVIDDHRAIDTPWIGLQVGNQPIRASYFTLESEVQSLEEIDFNQEPTLEADVDRILQGRTSGSWWRSGPSDHFVARYESVLPLDAPREVEFTLRADDGARILVNGDTVVDLDGRGESRTAVERLQLPEGVHAIDVEYFEALGWAELEARWEVLPGELGHPISDPRLGGDIDWPMQGLLQDRYPGWGEDYQRLIAHDPAGSAMPVPGPETPGSLTFDFYEGRIAEIAALRIGLPREQNNTFPPLSVDVFVSQDQRGDVWEQVGDTIDFTVDHYRENSALLALKEPVEARRVRLDFWVNPNSVNRGWSVHRYNIDAVQIFERVESESYASILHDAVGDVLDPELGGHGVAVTSQWNDGPNSISGLLGDNTNTFWQPYSATYPQELIFAFDGHDLQSISGISATFVTESTLNSDWAPVIRVEATTDSSPLVGFDSLGQLVPDPVDGRASIQFSSPIEARYIKLVVIDPGVDSFGIDRVQIDGSLTAWLNAGSLNARNYSNSELDHAPEGNNTTLANAQTITEAEQISGLVNDDVLERFYRIVVPGDGPRSLQLSIQGLPYLTASIELLQNDGTVLSEVPASLTGQAAEFSWVVQPGTYFVRTFQQPTAVALMIDRSSSMAGAPIITALDTASRFVMGKDPEQMVALYSFTNELQGLTTNAAQVEKQIEIWRSSNEPAWGGTLLYDGILSSREALSDHQGPRAVIALSDGADSVSQASFPYFWSAIEHFGMPLFAVGYGADMDGFDTETGSTARDTLRSMALATEGAFYDAPNPEILNEVFEDISARINQSNPYLLSFTIGEGEGQLRVDELGAELISAAASGEALLILDASGSMRARTDEGRLRINAARTVLFDLLAQIPENVPLGLQLYGHSLPSEPKARSCRDSEIIVEPEAMNRQLLTDIAAFVEPQGQTPIGYSLAIAGQQLGDTPGALVVLLTDGEETCDAEEGSEFFPGRVLADLQAQGIDLRVNIVGFDITDPEVQADLSRLASSTGGQFYSAVGQSELATALQEAFSADVEILDDANTVVAHTQVGGQPVTLPVGHYRVRIGADDFVSEPAEVRAGEMATLSLQQEASRVIVNQSFGDQTSNGAAAETLEFIPEWRGPVTAEELVYKVQDLLAKLGYEPGPLDGAMGSRTRQAIDQFMGDWGLVDWFEGPDDPLDPSGQPTARLWVSLANAFVSSR